MPVEEVEDSFDGFAEDVSRRADLRELVGDLGRLSEDQRGALVLFEPADSSRGRSRAIGVQARQGQGARLPGPDRADGRLEVKAARVSREPAVCGAGAKVSSVALRCSDSPGGATHFGSGWRAKRTACSASERKPLEITSATPSARAAAPCGRSLRHIGRIGMPGDTPAAVVSAAAPKRAGRPRRRRELGLCRRPSRSRAATPTPRDDDADLTGARVPASGNATAAPWTVQVGDRIAAARPRAR